MKKNVFTFALALLVAGSAWAYDFKAGDLYYNIIDEAAKTVEVTYEYDWGSNNYSSNYSSLSGAVNIPETVSYNGTTYSVTSIGDWAFRECSALTQVNIPNSVTSIGDWAFYKTALYNNAENWTNNVLYIHNCLIEAKTKLSGSYEITAGTRVIADEAFNNCDALTQVTIPYSVTSIGNGAFRGCSALTQVNIPSSVTSIGSYAFYRCEALRRVNIPYSVTSIGNGAFRGCSALTQVNIPSSVTSIGDEAFRDCSALTQVNIPSSVTSIGDEAFRDCSALTQVNIPSSVTSIGDEAFRDCSALTQVNIPSSVTSIGDEAFNNCDALTQVTWNAINCEDFKSSNSSPFYDIRSNITAFTFGDQVEHIPAYLCYGMNKLTQVTIPNSVTSIGNGAFQSCSALTQVTIPDGVKSIGSSAFSYCSALTQVTIGNSVTSIGSYAFSGCSALTQVNIPNSVTSIGSYAFSGCSALTQVTIGNSVTSIASSAFEYCYALTAINVESGNTTYCSENGILFNKDKTTLVCYPAGKPETTYAIPESVTSIGDYAFYACSTLTQVTIPSSVASIGNKAFYKCYSITQVTWNAINCADFKSSDYIPFYDIRSNITNFIFGEQVEHIPACLCYGMDKLTEVTIPSSVTSIGSGTFYECSALTAVYYTGDVAGWCGITFAGPTSNPLYYAHNLYIDNTLVTRLNIPDGINEIKDYTFLGCNTLRQATIPDGVTSIGSSAFEGCSKLTQVTIPDGVTSIGDYTFSGCSALTQVTIPESVTSIREWAFSGCSALTQVNIPDNVTSIGEGVFYDCRALTQVTIPESVTSIGEWAFRDCSALTQVTIPNSVTSIGNNAFRNCSALTQVTIGNSVTSIGEMAFSYCSALTEMTVLATVPPTVGYDAFYDVNREIPVYVPAEALEDYWVAAVWEEFYYLQAMPANALQTPSMPESIRVYGGTLHNPQQLPVSLYDMQGRMVYSGTAATVSQPAGVYVLRCAGASGKVLF